MHNDRQARGDELLSRVLSGDVWASGIANDLLKEFFRGYPVEKLAALLRSDDEKVIQSGAWIASELARNARPILRHLLPLFNNANANVRYYCVETALTAATDEDGEVTGCAVSLIADDERPVRQMAFELMARADPSVLFASVPYIEDPETAALVEWALEVERESRNDEEIASRLRESDGLRQLFAVIAAARVYGRNPHYLQFAASSSDSDAQSFAASEFEWLCKMQEQALRRQERAERKQG